MYLANVTSFREQLGFDDMADINAAIQQGLDAAEPFLASRMNMATFAKASSSDIFWVETPTFKKYPMVNTQFRLSSGLLTAVDAIVRAPGPTEFDSGDAVSLSGQLQISLAKGIVSDFVTDYDHEFVRIDFTHGFDPDGSDAESYDLSQVPAWLQEAAKLQSMILLEHHTAFQQAGTTIDMKQIRYQLDVLMANNLRYAPTAIMPL